VHSHDPTSTQDDPRLRWLLPAIVALAALLRFWSLDFGVPNVLVRPDEMEIVGRAVRFLSGDLNPHFFHYPTLYFYLIGTLFAGYAGVLGLGGHALGDVLADAAVDPSAFLVLARGVTALIGVGSVWAVYALGRAMSGRATGLWAALILSVAPLHVRDSHFATTDVPLTLFLVLSVLFVLRAYRVRRWQDYALAGVFAGLSVSTKYVGLVMPGALAVAYALRVVEDVGERGPQVALRAALRDPGPWVFGGAMAMAFTLTSPYSLLDWALFSTHFRFQLGHLSGGHGVDLGIGGWYHLRYTLPLAVGWPVFVTALAGAVVAWRSRWRETLVLLAFPLLFYASTFGSRTLFLRYMLPIVPFLALFAGYALSRAQMRFGPLRSSVVAAAAVVLLAGPLYRSLVTDRLLGRTDSRVLAAEWLLGEVGRGSYTVYQTGTRWGRLQLPATADSLEALRDRVVAPASQPSLQTIRDYARLQAEARLEAARELGVGFGSLSLVGLGEGERPDWIVILESGLTDHGEVDQTVRRIAAEEYELVHSTPGVPADGPGWYDQHDAFYLPFTGFAGVARPGPTVTIYRRADPASEPVGPSTSGAHSP
jgi:Dolichyl-phosphate-mannose-protein mannosyltransferase